MRTSTIALVLVAVGLAACNDNNDRNVVTVGSNVLTGRFDLQTVNGSVLPAVVVDSVSPQLTIDALAGAISVDGNGAFTDVTTFQQTLSEVVSTRTVTCTGTYTVVGRVVTFVEANPAPDCGRTFTGVFAGAVLGASVLGVPAVFAR